jgi:CP family cyanate transporter-like MFS transporter
MPAVVKRDFGRRVPLMMGVYTALLGGVGAIASGIVVPISQAVGGGSDGWRIALASTCALLPIAIALWVWVLARSPRARAAGEARSPRSPAAGGTAAADRAPSEPPSGGRGGAAGAGIWRDPVAWLVAAYMGLQSSSFYMLVTWLAPYAASHGRTPVAAGFDVMIFQILGVIGSLAVPLALRGRARRWVPAALPVGGVVAAIGLILAPSALTVWAACAGLAAGASLNMSLTLMAERARDHATSSALSGMSQSVGYLFAAAGPIAFGALHAVDPGWTAPLLLLIAVLLAQVGVGFAAGRDRYVLEPR